MGIPTVMTKTTMKPAFLMEEIAVDLMLIHNSVQYVNVLKKEEGAVELQLPTAAIRVGLVMGIVMISTTI